MEKGSLNAKDVELLKQLNNLHIKMHNIFQTIFRRFGKKFVENASKKRQEKKDSRGSYWERELEIVYINRRTGERSLEHKGKTDD
ncbi:hypothetical protein CMO96_00410 [Candidatus Woesebacteria bacterium]|nr:hypothetical protein [Candidatus Woesebacteria bacterium]